MTPTIALRTTESGGATEAAPGYPAAGPERAGESRAGGAMSPDKTTLGAVSTTDLLREATGRADLAEAVDAIGGKALLFEAGSSEWHLSLPATGDSARSADTR